MVEAAVGLFAERGYAATSFNDIIERSGAPRGSIYHHFPGGKAELAADALRWTRDRVARGLAAVGAQGDSGDAVRLFVTTLGESLRVSDFHAGCAVAGVVLDSDDVLLKESAAVFAAWRRALADIFRRDGATAPRARRLAGLVVAAAEGALLLARAEQTAQPLTDVATELELHIRTVLPRLSS
jgi:TetR/AcrR family transcriptional repressor of lmrAB and yxaGH operons